MSLLLYSKNIASSKAFKWMAGMKVLNSFRVTESYLPFMHPSDIPDVEDPATFGCLLKLARDKLNDPTWFPYTLNEDSEIAVIERVLNGE